MNIRLNPLVIALALTTGVNVIVAGCNRQEATPAFPATAPAASPTTVGMEIDDTVVTTKVKSALLADQDIKGFEIKVETRKGMVQLSGFVDNQTQIDRAIALVRGIEGVKGVENGMTIKAGKVTVGNQVDDSTVTAKVKSALLDDPFVKSFDIAVATSKGEVQLSGFVNNQAQADRAMEISRAVEGVQNVINKMSIKK